jgi:VanZ family protein
LELELNMAKALKVLFWVCFVGLNALALSPAPYLPPLEIFNWWDKAQHAIGFGTLTVLAVMAYPHVSKTRMALLLCLQGVVIEVLQYWGGFRFGDWQDAVADAVGVGLGLVLVKVASKVLSKASADPYQN